MKSPREKSIVAAIMRYLNGVPNTVARKRWGTSLGVAGDPDISGCTNGCHFEFEVKRPGQSPTALQLKRLESWRNAGAITAVVNGLADVRAALASKGVIKNEVDRL